MSYLTLTPDQFVATTLDQWLVLPLEGTAAAGVWSSGVWSSQVWAAGVWSPAAGAAVPTP